MSSVASGLSTAVRYCESLTTPSASDCQPSDIRNSVISEGGSCSGSFPSNFQEQPYLNLKAGNTSKWSNREMQDPTTESKESQEAQGQKQNEILPHDTFSTVFEISPSLAYGLKPQERASRQHDCGTDKSPSLPKGLPQGGDLVDTIEHDDIIQSSMASARSMHTTFSPQLRHRCRNPSPEPERIRQEMIRSSGERPNVPGMH